MEKSDVFVDQCEQGEVRAVALKRGLRLPPADWWAAASVGGAAEPPAAFVGVLKSTRGVGVVGEVLTHPESSLKSRFLGALALAEFLALVVSRVNGPVVILGGGWWQRHWGFIAEKAGMPRFRVGGALLVQGGTNVRLMS